jgi:hypothetical protein
VRRVRRAGDVDFLEELFGPVAVLAAGEGDAAFLRAKVATARHYAAHVLVQAPMLRDVVLHGGDTTLGLSDEQF